MTDPWARGVTRAQSRGAWAALWFALPATGLATFEALYAYFRWADDVVDDPARNTDAVRRFVERQERVVEGAAPPETPGERAVVRVLSGPEGPRLRPLVNGMLAALRFDAHRGPGPIAATDLEKQVERVGDAFAGALWVCAGEPGPLPAGVEELARASCCVHLLRDREVDRELGYENRPPTATGEPIAEADWVEGLAADAERRFRLGEAALSAPMRWTTRWLLLRYSNRYRRVLVRSARIRGGECPSPA